MLSTFRDSFVFYSYVSKQNTHLYSFMGSTVLYIKHRYINRYPVVIYNALTNVLSVIPCAK